jgi:hypothetical protein
MKDFFSGLNGNLLDIDLGQLFQLSYLFELDPQSHEYQSWSMLLAMTMLLVGLLLFYAIKKKYISWIGTRKLLLKAAVKRHIWMSVAWIILAIFNSQGVPFLGMRFWPLLLAVLLLVNAIVATVLIYRAQISHAPEMLVQGTNYQEYLPKKNKHKK